MSTLFFALLLTQSACFSTSSTKSIPGKITGTIMVKGEFESTLKPTDVLYIIARNQQVGPPSAVKRIVHPKFPLTYEIGAEDAMMPGMSSGFENNSNITMAARISRLGGATPTAGDLEGVYAKNPAKPGDSGVDIVIDRIRDK